MSSNDDELVTRYLARLNAAASGMPADRRRELIDEITTHIHEAMATEPAPPGGIETVLDQLGTPEEIVRAAGLAHVSANPPGSSPLGAVEILAIIGLLIGGIVLPVIGWLAGVILLWISPRWKVGDKLLGTLVWPGGLLAPVFVLAIIGAGAVMTTGSVCVTGPTSGNQCSPPPIPPWLAITLAIVAMVAAVTGPIVVTIRLIRQARRAVALPEQSDPDLLTAPLPA